MCLYTLNQNKENRVCVRMRVCRMVSTQMSPELTMKVMVHETETYGLQVNSASAKTFTAT